MKSVLEREVDNSWDLNKDRILRYLYDLHENPFNYDDTPTQAVRLGDELQLSTRDANNILRLLVGEGLVEEINAAGTFYRISPKGIETVERVLRKL